MSTQAVYKVGPVGIEPTNREAETPLEAALQWLVEAAAEQTEALREVLEVFAPEDGNGFSVASWWLVEAGPMKLGSREKGFAAIHMKMTRMLTATELAIKQ